MAIKRQRSFNWSCNNLDHSQDKKLDTIHYGYNKLVHFKISSVYARSSWFELHLWTIFWQWTGLKNMRNFYFGSTYLLRICKFGLLFLLFPCELTFIVKTYVLIHCHAFDFNIQSKVRREGTKWDEMKNSSFCSGWS